MSTGLSKPKLPKQPLEGKAPEKSKVDLFSGKHTTGIVVGLLVMVCLICVMVLVMNGKATDTVIDNLFKVIILLVGFYAGNQSRQNID